MISIITPTYNRSQLLPRMITSVLNQSFSNWELLIMDDGSSDDTETVVKSFKDSRIKYVKGVNTGASLKRNEGVQLASGEYIIFLDSDDEVRNNWLKSFSNQLESKENIVVSCGWEKYNHLGVSDSIGLPANLGEMFDNLILNYLSGTLLMKKTFFQMAGGYDVNLSSGQHTELLIRLLPIIKKKKVVIKTINEPLVIIHLHKGERIRHNYDGIFKGCTYTLKKHEALFHLHPTMHFNYSSVAAVMALHTSRFSAARKYLLLAINIKPFVLKSYLRYVMSYLPFLVNRFYPNK